MPPKPKCPSCKSNKHLSKKERGVTQQWWHCKNCDYSFNTIITERKSKIHSKKEK